MGVLSVLLLLVATTTSFVGASTVKATKTTYTSKLLPRPQHQGPRYVVSSYCTSSFGEEPEPVAAAPKPRPINTTPPLWKTAYRWYLKSCAEKPFRTKGLTSATIAALGDVIAQQIEIRATAKAFSATRVATFFFCNLCFTGPFVHVWYNFLNVVGKRMDHRSRNQISTLKKTVTQVFLDQTLGTILFFPLYIFAHHAFESVIRLHQIPSLTHATGQCRKHLWGIIKMQFRIYPFTNMINFGLVPLEVRVLFTSTVSLFWNIYLCGVVG